MDTHAARDNSCAIPLAVPKVPQVNQIFMPPVTPSGLKGQRLKKVMMLRARGVPIKATLRLRSNSGVEGYLIGPDGKRGRKIELDGRKSTGEINACLGIKIE